MKLVIYLLLWALIFVLCVLIGARNGQLVEFNYLIAMGEYQLATLLGVFLVLGFCIGAFTLFLFNLRTRIKLRFVSSERDKLKKKLENSIHSKGESI
ncbi:lipopolysaccharide assembly protein LapA domain-containing protein [Corallincola holothuriorum]|uniref:lipopolysaccharide assembly protein LapA domain-containing protein n=1 Tax=Corallincola holothuriorum TaxID=2282215 RepID=UPI0018F1088F|nr:lipopolysaccharide assembly protein LapA domain-containing protein [Corallincola holothuriorum]